MIGVSFWLPFNAFLTYVVYTLTAVCPISDPSPLAAHVFSHNSPVTYHTCVLGHEYIKPVYLTVVLPRYQQQVAPVLANVDATLHLTSTAQALYHRLADLDKNHRVASLVDTTIGRAQEIIDDLTVWIEPRAATASSIVRAKLAAHTAVARAHLQSAAAAFAAWYREASARAAKFAAPWIQKVLDTELATTVVFWYNRSVEAFLAKANSQFLQEKSDFIKAEFRNLVKFNDFSRGSSQPAEDIASLLVEEDPAEYYDDEDVEVITIVLTSTLTETASSTATEVGISVEEYRDYDVIRLNQELELWDNKVAKTLEMAANNLEVEMKPIVDRAILSIKEDISSTMNTLQVDNYKQYQELNRMINEIHKDYERIKQSNDTTIETFTRQDVRDIIAAAYKMPEDLTSKVQKEYLVKAHEFVTNGYFKVIQDTIDILETFAETTISDFSKSLTALLDELKIENEEVSWQAWKQFHRVKEQLFDFRDSIIDTANEYKMNNANNKELHTIGLQAWNDYLKNVEFHVNFLLRDNDDYLKLARAKANVAFQMREGLVRELEIERASEEAKANEASEPVKAGEVVIGKEAEEKLKSSSTENSEASEKEVTEERVEPVSAGEVVESAVIEEQDDSVVAEETEEIVEIEIIEETEASVDESETEVLDAHTVTNVVVENVETVIPPSQDESNETHADASDISDIEELVEEYVVTDSDVDDSDEPVES